MDQVTSSHFMSQIQGFPCCSNNIKVFIFWRYWIYLWTRGKKKKMFERAKALFDACCSGKPEATPGESGKAAKRRSAYGYCSTVHQSCLRSQVKATAEVPGGYSRSLDPGKYIFHESPRANIMSWRSNKTHEKKKKKMSSKKNPGDLVHSGQMLCL